MGNVLFVLYTIIFHGHFHPFVIVAGQSWKRHGYIHVCDIFTCSLNFLNLSQNIIKSKLLQSYLVRAICNFEKTEFSRNN